MRFLGHPVFLDHADLEGLFSTIGVIAALLLGMQVASLSILDVEDMGRLDYRWALIQPDPTFREWVSAELNIMMELDADDESAASLANINSTVDILSPHSALLSSPPSDFEWANRAFSYNPSIKSLDHVYHATVGIFPLWKVSPFLESNSTPLGSSTIIALNAACMSIDVLTLTVSLAFYTTLSLSSSRADAATALAFARVATPVIVGAYVLLGAGTILFFYSFCFIQLGQSTSLSALAVYNVCFSLICVPGVVVSCCLAVVALNRSMKYEAPVADGSDVADGSNAVLVAPAPS